MCKVYLIIICSLFWGISHAQFETDTVFYSSEIGDSFIVHVSLPDKYYENPGMLYNVIFYLDSDLKSGRILRELYNANSNPSLTDKYVLIGVAHTGDVRFKRRRDFIPPNDRNSGEIPFARANIFYSFLVNEIIPEVNAGYRFQMENSVLCGHSLGGLFTLYAMFQNSPFTNFIALSPSIWTNSKSILTYDNITSESNLFLAAGGFEVFNRVLFNTKRFHRTLLERKNCCITSRLKIYRFSSHQSYLAKGISEAIQWIN